VCVWEVLPKFRGHILLRFSGSKWVGCHCSCTHMFLSNVPTLCRAWGTSTLNKEAMCSSETSADFKRSTQRYIPEDSTLHAHSYSRRAGCKDREPALVLSTVGLQEKGTWVYIFTQAAHFGHEDRSTTCLRNVSNNAQVAMTQEQNQYKKSTSTMNHWESLSQKSQIGLRVCLKHAPFGELKYTRIFRINGFLLSPAELAWSQLCESDRGCPVIWD
jgi:hypothetical protein